ncbi:MAG: hypothetical protein EZS28_041622, partial [Streblomastix strix]
YEEIVVDVERRVGHLLWRQMWEDISRLFEMKKEDIKRDSELKALPGEKGKDQKRKKDQINQEMSESTGSGVTKVFHLETDDEDNSPHRFGQTTSSHLSMPISTSMSGSPERPHSPSIYCTACSELADTNKEVEYQRQRKFMLLRQYRMLKKFRRQQYFYLKNLNKGKMAVDEFMTADGRMKQYMSAEDESNFLLTNYSNIFGNGDSSRIDSFLTNDFETQINYEYLPITQKIKDETVLYSRILQERSALIMHKEQYQAERKKEEEEKEKQIEIEKTNQNKSETKDRYIRRYSKLTDRNRSSNLNTTLNITTSYVNDKKNEQDIKSDINQYQNINKQKLRGSAWAQDLEQVNELFVNEFENSSQILIEFHQKMQIKSGLDAINLRNLQTSSPIRYGVLIPRCLIMFINVITAEENEKKRLQTQVKIVKTTKVNKIWI